jgi:transcriptional regulator with GAF, ATPase, and Fis domain
MASVQDNVTRRIGQLARVVHADESLERLLRRVAETAVDVIERCDAASVSMSEDGRVSTWVSTHAAAERADEHQYRTEEGPCLDAISTGQANFVDSLESDQRWPAFTPRAAAEGMAGVYSMPLKVGEKTVGALNLYTRAKPFAFPDLQTAEALAAQAAVTLANAWAYHRACEQIGRLEEALESRGATDVAGAVVSEEEH